jgi:hypothetical protein
MYLSILTVYDYFAFLRRANSICEQYKNMSIQLQADWIKYFFNRNAKIVRKWANFREITCIFPYDDEKINKRIVFFSGKFGKFCVNRAGTAYFS